MANYKDLKYKFPAESLISGDIANARITSGSVTQHVQPYISWQGVKTSAFTAVAGEGYPVDTSGGAITVTLPVAATVGDTMMFIDYGRTFATNKLTLDPNSLNLQGTTNNSVFAIDGSTISIVYVDATKGWVPTSDDDVVVWEPSGNTEYTTAGSHTFTVPADVTKVHVVCVGGGGSGGKGNSGQAGAGGALVYKNDITVVPAQTAAVVVGNGPGQSGASGVTGGASSFTYGGLATTAGGGGGGYGTGSGSGGSGGTGGTQQGSYSGGGAGGNGGTDPTNWGGPGGGGAGGYSGAGGAGRSPSSGGDTTSGAAGTGGGGGGGGKGGQSEMGGGGGGGVGIYGTGSSGAGGTSQGSNATGGGGGGGGSGGNAGSTGQALHGGSGGNYGGGHGGSQSSGTSGSGAVGAVRVIWGPSSRTFPSNAPNV
jgi:hypothetical protein